MLGKAGIYAQEAKEKGFIGADWDVTMDLTGVLPDDWRDFNKQWIPAFLEKNPGKTKIAAGLACGMFHTLCKGIRIGDIVLSPDGKSSFLIGEVNSDYYYVQGENLPHRRTIRWFPFTIPRSEMSETLKSSLSSPGAVCCITKQTEEIKAFIDQSFPQGTEIGINIEDPTAFAMEKHLEDFLVHNWKSTPLGKDFELFEEDGQIVGQQYPTDTGPIDILAISKDKKSLLVVELKKGRASDSVVGQILRYMGYVQDVLAEPGQSVRGVIIAMKEDPRLRRALRMTKQIELYRYKVDFKLVKT